jgi:hypothetical protein
LAETSIFVDASPADLHSRGGIPFESTISLRFLRITLTFLRLKISTFFVSFYKMLFTNKLEFSSLIDCFA